MEFAVDYWRPLIHHTPLGILSDLDGTLLPFADTPEAAEPTAELRRLVSDLANLVGVELMIVSGRARATLDAYFPEPRAFSIVAEHGAWRCGDCWEATIKPDAVPVDVLEQELVRLLRDYNGALLERKTWSLAMHFRRVAVHRKAELLTRAESVIGSWLAASLDFERLRGSEVLEIRPRLARKSVAVEWARRRLGPRARLIIIGDDVTDEDMFMAAVEADATVRVGTPLIHPTRARWTMENPKAVELFLRAFVAERTAGLPAPPTVFPRRVGCVASVDQQR